MPLRPRDGLYTANMQPGEPEPGTWQEFMQAVEEAVREDERKRARRAAKGAKRKSAKHTLKGGDLAKVWRDRKDSQRCIYVRKDGTRCKAWKMQGAERCHFHGGYRQNPKHPATVRRYRKGDVAFAVAEAAAVSSIYQFPGPSRHKVKDILREAGLIGAAGAQGILEGLKAMHMEDGGKAWRRWLAEVRRKSDLKKQERKAPQDRPDESLSD